MDEDTKEISSASRNIEPRRIDGRRVTRKTVGDDKAIGITAAGVQNNSITSAMLQSNVVSQAKLKYETATLVFGSADTSKTASVTTGDIILGFYVSAITSTPVASDIVLSISGTTLTGTRIAPGGAAAITYIITLLKS